MRPSGWLLHVLAMRIALALSLQLQTRLDMVRKILHEVPLVDGHNDLPWNIRKFLKNQLRDFRFSEDLREMSPWSRSSWSHTDLPRLREGMVAAQFWSAYTPCSAQHLDAVQLVLEQIDVIRRLAAKFGTHMTLVTTAEGIEEAHEAGLLASLIGVEGGHALGSSLGVLRMLHDLGARYLTLTHTCNTPWADCSIADEPGRLPNLGGLSHFGTLVVQEMNRIGMMVDLSHVSVPTMLDTLRVSRAPVIFSHSSAHALCNSSRNVPDHVLKLLAKNGGLIMVAFFPHFISCSESATLQDVAAHINHIRDVAGVDHVGLGAGYDGINTTPVGLEDVSKYPHLLAELLASGFWTEVDLQKLAGLNLLRVFRDVERIDFGELGRIFTHWHKNLVGFKSCIRSAQEGKIGMNEDIPGGIGSFFRLTFVFIKVQFATIPLKESSRCLHVSDKRWLDVDVEVGESLSPIRIWVEEANHPPKSFRHRVGG